MKIRLDFETYKLKKVEEELQAIKKPYGVAPDPNNRGRVQVRFEGTEEEGEAISNKVFKYFIEQQAKWN